jgi:tetratricopeptide (TPR) repeat protein
LSTTNAVEAAALASIAEAEQVIDRLHAANDPLLEEHLYEAWLRKGEALAQLGRHGERVELCDALIAHADAAPAGRALWIVQAFNAKGSAWRAMGEARREIAAYEEVERRFGDATTPEVRTWVAHAAFQRAVVAGSLGGAFAKVDMVRSCEDIVRRYAGDAPEATREIVARARIWRGELLADLAYPTESREAFDAVWRDLAYAPEPSVAARVGHARITRPWAWPKPAGASKRPSPCSTKCSPPTPAIRARRCAKCMRAPGSCAPTCSTTPVNTRWRWLRATTCWPRTLPTSCPASRCAPAARWP